MLDVYRRLAIKSANPNNNFKRIIVSSGDVDPVVGLHGTEAAVRAIGFAPGPSGRLPWFYNATATPRDTILNKPAAWGDELRAVDVGAQVGGYHAAYDTGAPLAFEFLTFRESGHMVPAYAPQRAAHILDRLIQNKGIAPPLPDGWADASDEAFYARAGPHSTTDGGIFAHWIAKAMSPEFLE